MELVDARFLLSAIAELGIIIPILIALYGWRAFSRVHRCFVCYLGCSFLVNMVSFICYFDGRSTHFLVFYQSLISAVFLFPVVYWLTSGAAAVLFLAAVSGTSVLLFREAIVYFRDGISDMYVTATAIDLVLCCYAGYYIITVLRRPMQAGFKPLDGIVGLYLTVSFFVNSVAYFFKKFMLQSQVNFYVYLQVDNLINLFDIVWLCVLGWAFYQQYTNTKWRADA